MIGRDAVESKSPHDHPDADLVCTSKICGAPLAGCSSGLFCVRCATPYVVKKRWGYADLKPSIYYVRAL